MRTLSCTLSPDLPEHTRWPKEGSGDGARGFTAGKELDRRGGTSGDAGLAGFLGCPRGGSDGQTGESQTEPLQVQQAQAGKLHEYVVELLSGDAEALLQAWAAEGAR
jgi:hypothetical protein